MATEYVETLKVTGKKYVIDFLYETLKEMKGERVSSEEEEYIFLFDNLLYHTKRDGLLRGFEREGDILTIKVWNRRKGTIEEALLLSLRYSLKIDFYSQNDSDYEREEKYVIDSGRILSKVVSEYAIEGGALYDLSKELENKEDALPF